MTRLVVVLAAALFLAGCAEEPPVVPPRPSTVEHEPAAVPADRERDAVLAAVRELDLCAVLESVAPPGSEAETSAPFACALRVGTEIDAVRVRVGELTTADRLALPVRDLGGAKAYVRELPEACEIAFPVSFRLALRFETRETCGAAEELAVEAAAVLAEPDTLAGDPVWDACGALAEAVDTVAASDDTPATCSDEPGEVVLDLSYGDPEQGTAGTVGGTTVWTTEDPGNGCETRWSAGELVAAVRALDCARVDEVVEALVPVLREPPPEVTAPQRPLLYALDEPDSPRPGACAFLEDDPCEPYVEVTAPSGRTEIARAALADPNVACAVALDAVTRHFGPLRPVTGERGCVFVEPARAVRVEVDVWSEPTDGAENVRPGYAEVAVAGHPGFRRSTAKELDYALATSARTDEPGTLRFLVAPGPLATGLPPGAGAKADAALTDILRAHFGE